MRNVFPHLFPDENDDDISGGDNSSVLIRRLRRQVPKRAFHGSNKERTMSKQVTIYGDVSERRDDFLTVYLQHFLSSDLQRARSAVPGRLRRPDPSPAGQGSPRGHRQYQHQVHGAGGRDEAGVLAGRLLQTGVIG